MSTINKRLDKLEKQLEDHLIESGEIRSDLKWLKKAFWVLATGGVTFNIIIVGYVVNHLLK